MGGEENCRKWLGGKPAKTNTANNSNKADKQNHSKQKQIIYRYMDHRVQIHRHSLYLKHLVNYKHAKNSHHSTLLSKQIAKGMICNKAQIQSLTNYHIDSDIIFNVKQ